MRLKWRVQGCRLDSYGRVWVNCAGIANHDSDHYHEQYGELKFMIQSEESPDWWAGRLFETEVPFVAPQAFVDVPAQTVPVPELMDSLVGEPVDIYEEFGNDRRGRRRRR